MKKVIIFVLIILWTSISFNETLVIELKNGKKITYEINDVEKLYFIEEDYELEYKMFGSYVVLKPLTGGAAYVSFLVKPYNNNEQIWFGGICGPDLKGGLGIFVNGGKIYLRAGDSCKMRIPNQWAEVVQPFSMIDINKWNEIKIKYLPGKELVLTINGITKSTTENIPLNVVSNKVYIGTDPRDPGKSYNFEGEIKNLKY